MTKSPVTADECVAKLNRIADNAAALLNELHEFERYGTEREFRIARENIETGVIWATMALQTRGMAAAELGNF
jgi:hypothetical protein